MSRAAWPACGVMAGSWARLRVPGAHGPAQQGAGRAVAGHGGRHPHVDHEDRRPDVAGEHVDGGATAAEVGHHLRRDLLGPGGDALGHDAVVPGEHRHGRGFGHRRGARPGNGAQLHAQLLQTAEKPRGLVNRSWCSAAADAAVGSTGRTALRAVSKWAVPEPALSMTVPFRSSLRPSVRRMPPAVRANRGVEALEPTGRGDGDADHTGQPEAGAVPHHHAQRGQARAQPGCVDQDPAGVGGPGRQPVPDQHGHELGAQRRHLARPAGQVDGVEELGQRRARQPVDGPRRLAGPAGGDDRGVPGGRQHVAQTQTGTGQELGERTHHHRPLVATRPSAGGHRDRTPRPRPRPVRREAPADRSGCGGSSASGGRRGGVERELGLDHVPTAEHVGHERDGLGAPVGEQEALLARSHGARQRGGGGGRVGIAPGRIEVPGEHGHRVGGHRVERLRQIEHRPGREAQGRRHRHGVAAVRTGRRHATHRRRSPPRRRRRGERRGPAPRDATGSRPVRCRAARVVAPSRARAGPRCVPRSARCPPGTPRAQRRRRLRPRPRWATDGPVPASEPPSTPGPPRRGAPRPPGRRCTRAGTKAATSSSAGARPSEAGVARGCGSRPWRRGCSRPGSRGRRVPRPPPPTGRAPPRRRRCSRPPTRPRHAPSPWRRAR